jgi:hypothetical protein
MATLAAADDESGYGAEEGGESGALGVAAVPAPGGGLETLTLEFGNRNLIVRAVQPELLLVLVGASYASRKKRFALTAEARGDARYPPPLLADQETDGDGADETANASAPPAAEESESAISDATTRGGGGGLDQIYRQGPLDLQRSKVDVLAAFLTNQLSTYGFTVPMGI